LAVLATAGTAFAQSTVSLTGIVGAAAQSYDVYNNGTGAKTVNNGARQRGIALTDATIKVGVTEDLGSGLKAAAGIEFDESSENFGNALNRRKTFVSLTGGFGQVSFTNVRSGNLLTQGMVAPANLYNGIYDGSLVVTRSPVDALTYGMKFGDFTASVQYVEGSTDGAQNAHTKVGVLNGGYAKGPLAVGIAAKMYNFRDPGAKDASARENRLEAFATYDLGVAKFGLGYDGKNVGTSDVVNPLLVSPANKYEAIRTPGTAEYVKFNQTAAWSVGVSAPLGAFTVGANYAKRDVAELTALVAEYSLSKRTSFNASLGRQTANAGTDSGNQYRIGMYHSF